MFRTVPLSIIRSFFTVHTAMVYVIQVCWQLASRIRMELQFHPDHARKLYYIYHCCVYSEKTPDDGQRNCPKHVEFHSKNEFEKLVHLVGFIIRVYHDARPYEVKIETWSPRNSRQSLGGCKCFPGLPFQVQFAKQDPPQDTGLLTRVESSLFLSVFSICSYRMTETPVPSMSGGNLTAYYPILSRRRHKTLCVRVSYKVGSKARGPE